MNRSRLLAGAGILSTILALAMLPGFAKSLAVNATTSTGTVSPATPMLQPRSGHTATLLPDGRVLIAGGMYRNQDFYRSAELYDPHTGKFGPAGEMKQARVGHAAVLLKSGKVLVVGGWSGHQCTKSAELYDPATRTFRSIAEMNVRRGQPAATLLENGDVLITGGTESDTPGGVTSAELFHADTLAFEPLPSMHSARISHTATLLNDGRVLIAGGRGESVTATAEIYDPHTKHFLETGNLNVARYKHTAGLLSDGRVLIAGGSDQRDWNGTMASAEVFDPHTGRFQLVSTLHDSRYKLPSEAVRLSSGEVLVAGGSKQVEIYDPMTMKFSVASGSLTEAWHFMTETRLNDGSVLLAGGYANDDRGTAQTWLYRRR